MQISVIGAGYVGLTTAAGLAALGHQVSCIDQDRDKIKQLLKGEIIFYEPELDELIKTGVEKRLLYFYFSQSLALREAEIIFICVGTPLNLREEIDLTDVLSVIQGLKEEDLQGKIIVLKSTVPVGSTAKLAKLLNQFRPEEDWDLIAVNPEFLREGSAVADFFRPDRIVIGSWSRRVEQSLSRVYKGFDCPFLFTDPTSAEMIKYASNTFLALKISFANELANLCDLLRIDVKPVLTGMGLDQRIGNKFLQPGIGFGGSCLPKDLMGMITLCRQQNYFARLFEAVHTVNRDQPEYLVQKLVQEIDRIDQKVKIALLGLSFKPNTDDLRSAPSLKLIDCFKQYGFEVWAYDPVVKQLPPEYKEKVKLCATAEETIKGARAAVIATEWEEFKRLDWETLSQTMATPLVIDGRNVLEPESMEKLGIRYLGVGRRNGVKL